ncbi:hypothetical protein [Streptomyces luteogriseus]|uniref:hypothetical protein n=1 Tax=Streptomyces luteogriseus TaxID=68233 RepID=UPI0037F7E9A9
MTVEQLALECEPDWDHPDWPGNTPDDDWDDEDDWPDDVIDDEPDPHLPDLRSQGLTTAQLRTMTDVPVSRRYL